MSFAEIPLLIIIGILLWVNYIHPILKKKYHDPNIEIPELRKVRRRHAEMMRLRSICLEFVDGFKKSSSDPSRLTEDICSPLYAQLENNFRASLKEHSWFLMRDHELTIARAIEYKDPIAGFYDFINRDANFLYGTTNLVYYDVLELKVHVDPRPMDTTCINSTLSSS